MRADLGFVEDEGLPPGLTATEVEEDELYLVAAPAHPWAKAPPERAAFAAGPWVMREPGSGTRARMDAALAGLGLSPVAALELPSNEAVRAAVEAGGGATLLSRLVVAGALARGALVRLPFPAARRSFRLLRHPERHETAAARAFLRLIAPG
jgi:DNA-binding transcriptional LysR family regulator